MDECKLPNFTIHDIGDIETLSQIYPQGVRDLDIPKIWKLSKGKNVTVAVLDSGAPNHPDVTKNLDIKKSKSFISNEGIYDDYVGHGTHTSSIIGASDNELGIVGISPEVTLICIKVLNKNGRSVDDSILEGLKYCLEIKPDIISMSLGGFSPMEDVQEVLKELKTQNIVVVCSAGNSGKSPVAYPAFYPEVIAVGSYSNTSIRGRSLFSSWGEGLDVLAPGEEILGAFLDGKYSVLSGTSQSAPHVTGLIALMISYYKANNISYTVDGIRQDVQSTCDDIAAQGLDNETGWGIINPTKVFQNIEKLEKVIKKSNISWWKMLWMKFLSLTSSRQ